MELNKDNRDKFKVGADGCLPNKNKLKINFKLRRQFEEKRQINVGLGFIFK